jgi:hypothetical protein
MITIRVESVNGLKINTTEMNTSIPGKLLKIVLELILIVLNEGT